ncbi:SPOR domain-containing protein [Morganella psychrotolerans]|uniref:Protein DamX n=1 Tax=Morganella psychrotolerans TaxID=368603 RepID=A0A5M9RA53_9GAMM|nr:SPOR domain-containing protein [Morganella psychrotolerans]KAA8717844.1 protein DamX [Morganella psychrotolerans]
MKKICTVFFNTRFIRITAALLSLSVIPCSFSITINEKQDTVESLHDLGVQYINGDGISVSPEKGRYYIHQSALRGYPLGKFHLGILFYTGVGGDKDISCARWWLGKSALSGDETANRAQHILQDIKEDILSDPTQKEILTKPTDIQKCMRLPESPYSAAAIQGMKYILSVAESTPVTPPFLAQINRGKKQAEQIKIYLNNPLSLLQANLMTRKATPVTPEIPEEITITIVLPPPVTIYPSETVYPPALPVQVSSAPEKTQEIIKSPAAPKTKSLSAVNSGNNLRTAPGRYYTLQLSSAATPEGLYDTARHYKLSNYVVYETVRHGRQWYVLVYGDYPDLTSARRALKNLPAAITANKPWVRSLKQVQAELMK